MPKTSTHLTSQQYVALFNAGVQKGFNYLYDTFRKPILNKARRCVGDYCVADTIMQESFVRLWVFRSSIRSVSQAEVFLINEVKEKVQSFYRNEEEYFHRNLVQLDAMASTDRIVQRVVEEEEQVVFESYPFIRREWTGKIRRVIPFLNGGQQQLLRLCLRYNFNYIRVAEELGDRNTCEINVRVRKVIDYLRVLFESMEQEDVDGILWTECKHENQLEPTEEMVLFLRLQKRYSFQKIAEEMNLEMPIINTLFVKAYRKKESF